jgi:cytidine deaminase
MISMNKRKIISEITEYTDLEEMAQEDRTLIHKAMNAASTAYAPYSKFRVGAAVLLENNEIISGNNQENAVFPVGLCAERVAVFYAHAKYPDVPIKSIAVSAIHDNNFTDNPVGLCGSCRQVLLESENRFHNDVKIIMFGRNKIIQLSSVKDLLPLHFDLLK